MKNACLATIMSLGLCTAASADVVFDPFTTLVTTTVRGMDIAVKPNGTLGYVYAQNTADHIRYAELGGPPVTVSNAVFNNYAPRLAYDSNGQARVAYYKAGVNDVHFNYQSGGVWQGAVSIGDANSGAVGLFVDGDDNVHVSYQTGTDGVANKHRYRMRTAAGAWEAERTMYNSTSVDWTRAGAHLIATDSENAFVFTQSSRNAVNTVGGGRNSPYAWQKTDSGDFTRKMIPTEDYAVYAGGNDSAGHVTIPTGNSTQTSADLMSSAFRGDAIDLAAVQRWTGTSDYVGYVTLYLDVVGGNRTPIKISDQANAREVSMVIDSSGTHYVFYVAPHDFDGVTKAALWLQIAEADGTLVGSNTLLSDSTLDIHNVKAAIGPDDVLHLGFIANGNSIRYTSAVIPEPSSLGLIGLGAAYLLSRRRH